MPDIHQPSSPTDDGVDDHVEEADTANGEPNATKQPTGDAQAAQNREDDPPA
jgi:hypothetical protein